MIGIGEPCQTSDTLEHILTLFRAKIPLLVVDDTPPGYTSQEEMQGASRGPFKYAPSQDSGEAVPELECLVSTQTIWSVFGRMGH